MIGLEYCFAASMETQFFYSSLSVGRRPTAFDPLFLWSLFCSNGKISSNKKGNKMKPFTFVGVDRTDPINVWSSFLKMAFSIAILLPIYFNLWDVLVVGANSVVLNVCLSRLNQKRPSCHFEAFHYCKKILNTTRIGDNNKNCCPCTDTAMEKSTFLYLIILYFSLKLIQTIIIIVYI